MGPQQYTSLAGQTLCSVEACLVLECSFCTIIQTSCTVLAGQTLGTSLEKVFLVQVMEDWQEGRAGAWEGAGEGSQRPRDRAAGARGLPVQRVLRRRGQDVGCGHHGAGAGRQARPRGRPHQAAPPSARTGTCTRAGMTRYAHSRAHFVAFEWCSWPSLAVSTVSDSTGLFQSAFWGYVECMAMPLWHGPLHPA